MLWNWKSPAVARLAALGGSRLPIENFGPRFWVGLYSAWKLMKPPIWIEVLVPGITNEPGSAPMVTYWLFGRPSCCARVGDSFWDIVASTALRAAIRVSSCFWRVAMAAARSRMASARSCSFRSTWA
ncbi:hypothetical protein [Acidiphilium sp. 34-64-41]|uniref:hypothetical protein n=1 Tax=Acidiphilium sp. 34-64-41 TaxID=1970297 RepID=UPI002579AE97|nr:hypothetical protein [Acidiphilium sp. 34-64-41]